MTFEPETLHLLVESNGERRSFTYRLRLYTATELVGLLERAGFGSIELYGTVEGAELSRETRLVAVARP